MRILDKKVSAVVSRALTVDDLDLLSTVNMHTKPSALVQIRAIHHKAARMLGAGMKAVEVSAVVGLTQNRLSILQDDPTFGALVQFYTDREDARFEDVQDRTLNLGLDAGAVLHERILDSPEEIPTKDLIDIFTTALDRAGHAPKQRKEHVHVHLTEAELTRIKAEVGQAQTTPRPVLRIITGDATKVSPSEPTVAGEQSKRESV